MAAYHTGHGPRATARTEECRPRQALLHRALLHRALLHWALLRWALLHWALLHRALLYRALLHWALLRWALLRWALRPSMQPRPIMGPMVGRCGAGRGWLPGRCLGRRLLLSSLLTPGPTQSQ